MTVSPIPFRTVSDECPAAASRRLSQEASRLAFAAENAALSVWREAMAEAEALAILDGASVGGRQIARDVARALELQIGRLATLHARQSR